MVVSEEQYKQCAATCILIAAKSYERDETIPKSQQFHEFLTQEATTTTIIECERQILNTLSWEIESYPTFFSLLEIFRA